MFRPEIVRKQEGGSEGANLRFSSTLILIGKPFFHASLETIFDLHWPISAGLPNQSTFQQGPFSTDRMGRKSRSHTDKKSSFRTRFLVHHAGTNALFVSPLLTELKNIEGCAADGKMPHFRISRARSEGGRRFGRELIDKYIYIYKL